MNGILEAATRYIPIPYCTPSNNPALTGQQVTWLQLETLSFSLRELHGENVSYIDSIPLHVCIPQIWSLIRPAPLLRVDGLAELSRGDSRQRGALPSIRNTVILS